MKIKDIIIWVLLLQPVLTSAQDSGEIKKWSLTNCIDYALNQNIQVRQSILTNISNQVYKEQAQAQKLPSLGASANQNFSWSQTDESSGFKGTNNSNFGVSSNITVYNGKRLNMLIDQAELDLQKGIYDSESIKESITISVLNAFLQVVFNEENTSNAQSQLEATEKQLELADIRLQSGIIARSDYLQVKSQVATEKLNLANAKNQLNISKVSLMQLMELPVVSDFSVIRPEVDEFKNLQQIPIASDVYSKALDIRPEIKSAALKKESAAIAQNIAHSGYFPTLTASAGISTGYSSINSKRYSSQLNDNLTPTIGASLSIPIFQKKQNKTNVAVAKISYQSAELEEIDTQNQLRKAIEQACVDVISAQSSFEASEEKFASNQESYVLAEEQFKNGIINSVDFLFEKTNLITAESELLQARFDLVFSYKILDFYLGNPIIL